MQLSHNCPTACNCSFPAYAFLFPDNPTGNVQGSIRSLCLSPRRLFNFCMVIISLNNTIFHLFFSIMNEKLFCTAFRVIFSSIPLFTCIEAQPDSVVFVGLGEKPPVGRLVQRTGDQPSHLIGQKISHLPAKMRRNQLRELLPDQMKGDRKSVV